MSITMKQDPRLGRVYRHDPRNANFPMRAAIPSGADLHDKAWKLNRREFLVQNGPRCTAFSAVHDLESEPGTVTFKDNQVAWELAQQLYDWAQKLDEWPGEGYEGSSVLGATQGLFKLGFAGEYRWAGEGGHDPADDLALCLSNVGPCVLGTDFFNDMFELRGGVMVPTGALAGGHAYLARWIAASRAAKHMRLPNGVPVRDEPLIGGPNSWGLDWGTRGEWAMWLSDARRLLAGINSPGEARVSSVPFKRVKTSA
jgi:hypothetical protein